MTEAAHQAVDQRHGGGDNAAVLLLSAAAAIEGLFELRMRQAGGEGTWIGTSGARLVIEVVEQPGIQPGRLGVRLTQKAHSISSLLNRLEDNGLVERRRDLKDRRVVHVHPTDLGRTFAARAAFILGEVGAITERQLLGNRQDPLLALGQVHEKVLDACRAAADHAPAKEA